jgi:outer membrane protein TolC
MKKCVVNRWEDWVLRIMLCVVMVNTECSIVNGQLSMSLEQAIRQAQDSTILAFQSKYELSYNIQRFDEFMALRKPQLMLRVAPNYQKIISDPTRDYVYLRNFNNLSAAASVNLTQKMLNLGGEAYVGTQAVWTEYFGSKATYARQYVATPILFGYRQNLLGYNPYRWEKIVEDQRVQAARLQHQYDLNNIAEEVAKRFFKLVCAQGQYDMYQRNLQAADTLYAIACEKASIAMVTLAELRSLELQRMNAANALEMARTSVEDARIKLASYLQLTNGDELAGVELQFAQQPPTVSLTPAEAIDLAMANNPAYRLQVATVTESRQQAQKAYKEKGVNVALDINVGMQQVDNKILHAYRDQRLYALGGITLSVPLMDHGAAKSRYAAAQAWVSREESALDEMERRLKEDVMATMNDIRTYWQLLERTSEAMVMADEVFVLNADNYANGLSDINTYTLAQNRRDDAYTQYLSALEKYWITYYHLMTLTNE